MPLFKVKFTMEVVVEAEHMPEALDKGHEAIFTDKSVPTVGAGTLITRRSQIPKDWINRKVAGTSKRCVDFFPEKTKTP